MEAATTPKTAVKIPEWVINIHTFRQRLFMQIVEPVIVFILGPVEDDFNNSTNISIDETFDPEFDTGTSSLYDSFHHQQDRYDHHHPYTPYINESTYNLVHNNNLRRKLSFLPNYVEDARQFRETTMSFATLAMLFTIMTSVMFVFLSCFYHNQQTSPLFISPRRHRLPRLVPPPLPVDGTFSWVSFIDELVFVGCIYNRI